MLVTLQNQSAQHRHKSDQDRQHILFFSGITCPGPGMIIFFPDSEGTLPLPCSSSATRFFLFTILKISVNTVIKAGSTLVASNADVSKKNRPSFCANSFASSVGTALWFSRSHLFPISIMTMFMSACPRNSSSHLGMWSKVWRLVMS